MTSDAARDGPRSLYAWVWLPGAGEPVVAGVLSRTAGVFAGEPVITFTYARSYLERAGAVSLFAPELPLHEGTFDPTRPGQARGQTSTIDSAVTLRSRPRSPLPLHGCLRDAAPDAWGRRVINLRLASDPARDLSELTYLRESGSDRIGALDFQDSPEKFVRRGEPASLAQLLDAAEYLEAGSPLPSDLQAAAQHGTSVGGARPKALLRDDDGRHLIAKFPSSTDTRPVVKAEAAAMLLADRVGIAVAPVRVVPVGGRDVLLVERFDRRPDGTRRMMVSALTVLGEGEMGARHASYADLAESFRVGPWTEPGNTVREMFTRLVFNVCVGNTDDHLRNHAAFWDGRRLTLTPAYDVEPVARNTPVAGHAIAITRDGQRASQLHLCRAVAADFQLTSSQAEQVIDTVVSRIHDHWEETCDLARLTTAERAGLWGREILNEYIFRDEA